MKEEELPLKDLRGKIDNIFVLINLAGKRVKELVSGAPKLIQTECDDPIQIALEEIAQGKITVGKHKDTPEKKQEVSKEKKGRKDKKTK
jgi:DNA-directed RNA polymerase omega subunit